MANRIVGVLCLVFVIFNQEDTKLNLLSDIRKLQQRMSSEYDLFYKLQKMPNDKLIDDMKNSDFDRMKNGTHTENECVELYRSKCRGRMTTAGNVAGELRALIGLQRQHDNHKQGDFNVKPM